MRASSPRSVGVITITLVVVGLIALALGGYLSPLYRYTINPLVSAQSWLSIHYMAFHDFITVPRDVASLRQRNAQLEGDNSRLQAQVIELQQQLSEAQYLYTLTGFARSHPENRYIAASVIGRDPNPFMRYVQIDHGTDAGLRHGMPVVTAQGLIGRVSKVTSGGALIELITDPSSTVNIKLQSTQKNAVLNGSLTGDLSLDMIPQELKVPNGEVVLTSGLGGNYPANLVIGQVISVRKNENELFQSASVQPAVDFSALNIVLVITNFTPVDITPLVPPSQ